jgi:hypothetical protein
MKTIIQSFGYPDIAKGEKPYFEDTEVVEHLGTLKSHQKSIYETYYAIREEMRSNLSEEAYNEIEPYITVALDVLAHD